MKTLFSADPFQPSVELGAGLGQQNGCVLIGTETHPSDFETLFQRSIEKYEALGWSIVRRETGRVFYDGTADMTRETNIWACPPGYGEKAELGRRPWMGAHKRSGALEGSQVAVKLGQAPGHPGVHWGIYNGQVVRWPDCDPRYDANCPYPTQVITDGPALGQVGAVAGFGGPGGGFGFAGGPGGLVGPVAGAPGPGGGAPISGPSIPCGPAGYGPTCAWPNQPQTVVQPVYRVNNLMGSARGGQGAAHGRTPWEHPMAPCPPGYFRSAPGSPCVKEGDLEDYGEGYFQNRPW